jgi:hypothetical protein
VPIQDPVATTLAQGQFTLLYRGRFEAVRVTITALSNEEAGGVVFKVSPRLPIKTRPLIRHEVALNRWVTILGARIEASTPEGIGSLEVTYVVKTGADAA